MYKKLKDKISQVEFNNQILRTTDGAIIPFDLANTDYQEYLAWVAEGNTPEEAE